jgi:hypothetical protein
VRWAGPDWAGRGGVGAPGVILGATVAVGDPGAVVAEDAVGDTGGRPDGELVSRVAAGHSALR